MEVRKIVCSVAIIQRPNKVKGARGKTAFIMKVISQIVCGRKEIYTMVKCTVCFERSSINKHDQSTNVL